MQGLSSMLGLRGAHGLGGFPPALMAEGRDLRQSGYLPAPFLREGASSPPEICPLRSAKIRLALPRKCPGLPRKLPLQTAADMVAQFEDAFVGHIVDDIWPLLATTQNSCVRQSLQMPGNIGLVETCGFHKPGDISFPLLQRQNQFQPARFAQDTKPRGNELKRLWRQILKFCLTRHGDRGTGFHFEIDYMRICSYGQFYLILVTIMKVQKRTQLEGAIRILAGTSILVSLALTHWMSSWWLLLTAFVGLNLVQSALTGFCPAEMNFRKLGVGRSAEE